MKKFSVAHINNIEKSGIGEFVKKKTVLQSSNVKMDKELTMVHPRIWCNRTEGIPCNVVT